MKEERFFYAPDVRVTGALPDEEAGHAVRVLRLREGDPLWCMDGAGSFLRCQIAVATNHKCLVKVLEDVQQPRAWRGLLTLAFAPTKNMDRTEWLVEKAVEIGVDRLVMLDCHNSERRIVKPERVKKIIVSAMKQSRKAWKTQLEGMMPFKDFVDAAAGSCYIAHCHDMQDLGGGEKPFLLDMLNLQGQDCTVLVGPEGDFSREEVLQAMSKGFKSVSLGNSRLRTETAGLVAAHIMQIAASRESRS